MAVSLVCCLAVPSLVTPYNQLENNQFRVLRLPFPNYPNKPTDDTSLRGGSSRLLLYPHNSRQFTTNARVNTNKFHFCELLDCARVFASASSCSSSCTRC